MNVVLSTVRVRFFDVKQMTTEELQSLIESNNNDNDATCLLVDVRETNEHEISTISNSHLIVPSSDISPLIDDIRRKSIKKVVAYCSLGYRSCKLIQKLKCEFPDVDYYSLEGGLFKWANENRTIVNSDGEATNFVHPYNIVWGKLLAYERRKYSNDLSCDKHGITAD